MSTFSASFRKLRPFSFRSFRINFPNNSLFIMFPFYAWFSSFLAVRSIWFMCKWLGVPDTIMNRPLVSTSFQCRLVGRIKTISIPAFAICFFIFFIFFILCLSLLQCTTGGAPQACVPLNILQPYTHRACNTSFSQSS